MEILDQNRQPAPGMPRFDDGMVNIGELIRTMAESLVNEIMDAQAGPGKRSHPLTLGG